MINFVFCPSCGKKSNGFCDDCKPIEEIKAKEINIKICSLCGKYFKNNKWLFSNDFLVNNNYNNNHNKNKHDTNIKDTSKYVTISNKDISTYNKINYKKIIENIAKSKIKDNVEIDFSNFNFNEINNKKKPGVNIDIILEVIKDNKISYIPVKIIFTYCPNCSKKNSKYYEGTLQLRNTNDEIISYVENYIKKNNISIANKIQKNNDYDLDISDQRKLQNLAQNLKKNFGGELKISIRQFTQDRLTSKQIYRVNALYEAPDYKKGDVIKIENNLYLITNLQKSISAIDLKTGKKSTLNKIKDYEILKQYKTKITKIYPDLEVLDPETYQSVPVINKENLSFKISENVKIINDNGFYYIIK